MIGLTWRYLPDKNSAEKKHQKSKQRFLLYHEIRFGTHNLLYRIFNN
jgi:hypothetical protein